MSSFALRIGNESFTDMLLVDAIEASCSWDVASRGAMTALMTRSAFFALPFDPVIGRWVVLETPAGLWGGVVTGTTHHLSSRTVELNATDLRVLFEWRAVTATADLAGRTPGVIASRVIAETDAAAPLFLDDFLIDIGGEPITFQVRAGVLARTLDDLAAEIKGEWRVKVFDDLTTRFEFQRSLGRDLTGDVCLIEGVHVEDGSYVESTEGMANELLAVASDEDHENATRLFVRDTDSIDRYGKIQAVKEYPRVVHRAALRPIAQRDVIVSSEPTAPANLTVFDIADVYGTFEEGDRVRMVLYRAGVERSLRVTTRSYANGLLAITGTTEELDA